MCWERYQKARRAANREAMRTVREAARQEAIAAGNVEFGAEEDYLGDKSPLTPVERLILADPTMAILMGASTPDGIDALRHRLAGTASGEPPTKPRRR
jgi:hypothetical protein